MSIPKAMRQTPASAGRVGAARGEAEREPASDEARGPRDDPQSTGNPHKFERALVFYDAVLATLGVRRLMEHPGAVCYGKQFPEFWVQTPIDGARASAGNGTHIGFAASSREQVHAFHDAALQAGATAEGAPGPRPHYGAPYYGCFVRDLDGHKIEAAFWDASLDRA